MRKGLSRCLWWKEFGCPSPRKYLNMSFKAYFKEVSTSTDRPLSLGSESRGTVPYIYTLVLGYWPVPVDSPLRIVFGYGSKILATCTYSNSYFTV